ncbi:Sugar Porter (MFS) [Blattamonas nauphoetae]|uniref:Sugar Porter (MFS) n=1 Tax=Blattamonas nauphoetae TaxID=2049346 RepID=A0ABQ9X0W6_9EUKA|nr:Sugar Porter (MFS) [Blattamonas nauphoetae]
MTVETGVNHKAALLMAIAGGMSFGSHQSITSGIMEEQPWSDFDASLRGLMSSSVLIGATIGALVGGTISDKIGPKRLAIICSIWMIVCTIVMSIQSHIALFITFRILDGLPVGVLTVIGPLYVSEQCSSKRRGTIGAMWQMSVCLGILVDYLLNLAFHAVKGGYHYEFGIIGIFPIILLIGLFFCPESSGYLSKKSKAKTDEDKTNPKTDAPQQTTEPETAQPTETVTSSYPSTSDDEAPQHETVDPERRPEGDTYRGEEAEQATPEQNTQEVAQIGREDAEEEEISFCGALFYSKRAFIVGVVLALMGQLSGCNAIVMYSPSMFAEAGVVGQVAKLSCTVGVGGWNLLSTILAVFMVDCLGRKPLLTAGFSCMGVGHLLVVLSTVIPALEDKKWALSIPGLFLFVFGFEIGPGPCFFVLVSELYPVKVRGTAMSVMLTLNWIANVVIVQLYPSLVLWMTTRWVFTMFTILCAVTIVFIIFVVKETKGKSLDEITKQKK